MEKPTRPIHERGPQQFEQLDAVEWKRICWSISFDAQVLSEMAAAAEKQDAVEDLSRQREAAAKLRAMLSTLEKLAQSLP